MPALASADAAQAEVRPPSRAGRPTAARVEAINQAILDAARDHFLSAGFEATPMEAVAASAGVSKGTLYARYPTKEALLRVVVQEQLAAWRANETRRLGPLPDGFRPRMVVHARAIIEALGSERMRAFETLVGGAGSHGGELARALHETGYRMAIEGLTEEIVEGTRGDPAPPRDPARVAEMLMALLYGWYSANESVRGVSAVEARDFADEAVAMLFAARAAW